MSNPYQTNNPKPNLQIPQFHPTYHQKNAMSQQKQAGPSYLQKQINHYQHQQKIIDNSQNFGSIYSQLSEQEKHQYLQSLNMNSLDTSQYQPHQPASNHNQRRESSTSQKPKLACKPFTTVTHSNHKSVPHHDHQKEKSSGDSCKQQTSQPIDLSGSTTPGSKLKVKQHFIDPASTAKLLKHHDDVPEVGSTTASIEEMQDAHKHLWHPLFGK
ncbi:hypothetical protein NQ314_020038 [Rhamnusium bicolor]|uniref:Uncharacterized protein n=1 Tax=Rhamnusium bicolor TaxID=1586634 RepID=A0AAV8WL78_9CUCU|nr:hypothetical protein NQ314_020038 [Rhamnusium bicolor]